MVSSSWAYPSQAESWCGRLVRRPNVSLIWQQTQIAEMALDLGSQSKKEVSALTLNIPM